MRTVAAASVRLPGLRDVLCCACRLTPLRLRAGWQTSRSWVVGWTFLASASVLQMGWATKMKALAGLVVTRTTKCQT